MHLGVLLAPAVIAHAFEVHAHVLDDHGHPQVRDRLGVLTTLT
jgi:hypothetical protein